MSFTFRSVLLQSAGIAALVAGGLPANAQTVNGGGSTLATPTYQAILNGDLTPPPTYNYYPSASGAAQTAFLNNTISSFGAAGVTTGAVDFGASDATLTTTQINSFSTTYGYPLIQVPSFGTPITLAFHVAGKTTDGALTLTDATASSPTNSQVCGVLSGKITDWHTIDTTVPAGSLIQVEYRADNSGTTFLLTQHLAAVCNATNSNFFATGNAWASPAVPAATQAFASLFGTVPSTFHAQTGSPGVESAILSTSNAVGYLSPDYTQIATDNLNNPAFPPVLRISTTEAGVTTAYLPNTANTAAALGTALPPATTTLAANPANWIPAVPNPTTGYPIVGYTTLELSSCYASTPVANGVIELLHALYDSTGVSPFTTTSEEVGNRGFVLVPGARINGAPTPASSFAATILSTFVTGGTKLAINNATTCTGHTGR